MALQTGRSVQQQGVDDLVMLPKINEGEIVTNINKRYTYDLIYTYIGPVLISVNPYKNLGNSGKEFVPVYHGHFPHENPPHVYALGEEAYRSMKGEGVNQCVLISGESGAGKTEAAKILMGYISFVTGGGEKVEYVKSVVLQSNPLLEAFGNAKTIRNNNSSRFGKYMEIQFDQFGDPCGGKITNYLLEKSRVVFQQSGERGFHFFYNFLAGATQQERQQLALDQPSAFYYINQGETYTVEGMDDNSDYQEVRQSMDTMGIPANEQSSILHIVASLLHLGNVFFQDGPKGHAVVHNPQNLDLAANIFQVNKQTLNSAICFRVINTGGSGLSSRSSTYNVPQNADQAHGAKDALARGVYDRLFDWIVAKINAALSYYQLPHKTVIGILDIYGFEIFNKNGFEQFCINYVNEKLQQYFIELTLKAEQEEYVKEGIKWTPIQYFNNQIVVDLIEGKKGSPGLFSVLDDVCYTVHAEKGNTTDFKFLEKGGAAFGSHPHFKSFNGGFQIKHYAGNVIYEVEGFSDKNKDTLFSDLIETVQTSGNKFLASLFPEDVKTSQKKRPTTAGFKIKSSCIALMNTLSQCNPHYIRCIKPNDNKAANDWNEKRVCHQVQYLGLLENVRVKRAGYAYRAPFDRFLLRYKKLSKKTWGIWGEWNGSPIEGARTICQELQLDQDQWQLGKTKIFIRYPETLFFLEELIERKDYECACKIQKAWKKWKLAKKALEQKAIAANLLKGKKERRPPSTTIQYVGDYCNYDFNYNLQKVVSQGKQEAVLYADQVLKLNRRNKPERRDFVLTDQAIYICLRKVEQGQATYSLSRRANISNVQSVSLSTKADNYICFHVPAEYDILVESKNKTELLVLIHDAYKKITGGQIQMNFSDSITYKIKSGDTRSLQFYHDPSAQLDNPVLKKAGKILKVGVQQGLDPNTDTAPEFIPRSNPTSASPMRGAQGGQRGGSGMANNNRGAQRGASGVINNNNNRGAQRGAQQGAQRGASGAINRGAQQGGQRGAQRGAGPQRGGGQRGAQRGAGPQRGGGQRGMAPAPAPAPTPAKPAKPSCTAQFDYQAQSEDELSFKKDDIITVLQKDPGGWWEGELNGKVGWIPANFVAEN